MENFKIVEYQSQRVLTTEQLAQAYECETYQIKQNFNNNKDRFVEGKHYFKLEGDLLKDFKMNKVENFYPVAKNTKTLYLWTKRGASRHCKMLGTDKAWDMFDILEENYFDQKIQAAPYVVIPKFFKGQQVLTIKDVAAILNTTRSFIEGILSKPTANIREGRDYYRLKGEDRAEFKKENPSVAPCVHHIIAILKSGFKKICEYLKIDKVPQVFSFENLETKLEIEAPTEEPNVREAVSRIRAYKQAQEVLFALYDSLQPSDMKDAVGMVISHLGVRVCANSMCFVGVNTTL